MLCNYSLRTSIYFFSCCLVHIFSFPPSITWERKFRGTQFPGNSKLTEKENDSEATGGRCRKKKNWLKGQERTFNSILRLNRWPEKLEEQGLLHDSSLGGKVG